MTIRVPYLSTAEIERETTLLLSEYEEMMSEPVKLPVPVDDITTSYLALQLGSADLHETLQIPMLREEADILGAIWMEKEIILIDESLDPRRYPRMRGRYRFSVAHEVGHWRLHRDSIVGDASQGRLLGDSARPTFICRSSERKKPIEWQADYFASCLLIPRARVFAEWREHLGRDRPLHLSDLQPTDRVLMRAEMKLRDYTPDGQSVLEDALLEEVAKPIAHRFAVSASAMRIRLEHLGLFLREEPKQQKLAL